MGFFSLYRSQVKKIKLFTGLPRAALSLRAKRGNRNDEKCFRNMRKSIIKIILFILLLNFNAFLHAEFVDQSTEAIEDRIAPIGKVRIGENPNQSLPSSKPYVHLGKAIFEEHCILCHGSGIAGAPRFGDKPDWKSRVKKKLSLLLEHVENGYGAMPRKGTCLECSPEDLKTAIRYMVKKST